MKRTVLQYRARWWETSERYRLVSISTVRDLALAALDRYQVDHDDAEFIVEGLLAKDCQGDHLRGIRDLRRILEWLASGVYTANAPVRFVSDAPSTAVIDGGRKALPQQMSRRAMLTAIQKARATGVGAVGVLSRAFTLGQYVRLAVDAGMIGFGTTQSRPFLAPFGGRSPILSDGPFAFGIPTLEMHTIILDMATTQTSATPVVAAARRGERVLPGLILDETGLPTTNPQDFVKPGQMRSGKAIARGSLVPIGGYKGYGLALVLSIFSSLLVRANPSWDLSYDARVKGARDGSFFLAIDVRKFVALDEFTRQADAFLRRVKRSPRAPWAEEILYPGERSQKLEAARRKRGKVPLPEESIAFLRELGREIGREVLVSKLPS